MGVLRELSRAGGRDQDEAAVFITAVYVEHGQALLAYALRLTGDRGRAEDVVQETLIRAWKHAGALASDGRPLRPWLFTVLTNLVISEHRARRRRPYEVIEEWIADPTVSPELDRAMEAWQLQAAVAQLSSPHREVLLALYFHGLNVTEAAQALGIPVGTVKSRSFYALRALRLILEESGWGS